MSTLRAKLDEHRNELRRFLIARTGSEADADDFLSELWIKAGSVDAGPIGSPLAYLYRMANNLALDRRREALRRARRDEEWTVDQLGSRPVVGDVPDDRPTAEELVANRDERARLLAAIDQIPPKAQEVLRMHKLEERSHAEVATALGISKSAVEKHMAVAMTHLRRLMGD